ncbi:MAG: hypothetical protein AAF664_13830 [Planctomycetota bacterium]
MAVIVRGGEVPSQSPIDAASNQGAAGIRTVEFPDGSLSTDYLPAETLRVFAKTLDEAIRQWRVALPAPAVVSDDFRIDGYIMRDESVFRAEALIDDRVPNFPYGYALADRFWLRAQPDENYTRHLMLHEAFHSFVWHHFTSVGPHWIAEGMAEMYATHQVIEDEIRVGIVPSARDGFEQWGRFRKLQEMRRDDEVPTLSTLFSLRPNLKGDIATYSASWLAVRLLRSRQSTRELMDQWIESGFGGLSADQVVEDLGDQWPVVNALWKLAILEADFGETITIKPPKLVLDLPPWDGSPTRHKVAANQSWYVVPFLFEPGAELTVYARGEAILANDPRPWMSQPPGITIRYHQGKPLGQLLAAWVPIDETDSERSSGLLSVPVIQSVGQKKRLDAPEGLSWLLLRINDAAGELGDNQGSYEVVLR